MQRVMITGIAGGFGKPTALALLERGYQVAGSVRSREGKNADTVAEFEAAGASIIEMDVTDTASTKRGVAEAVDHVGVGSQIERYNDVLHDVTCNVKTSFGIEDMLKLNA